MMDNGRTHAVYILIFLRHVPPDLFVGHSIAYSCIYLVQSTPLDLRQMPVIGSKLVTLTLFERIGVQSIRPNILISGQFLTNLII